MTQALILAGGRGLRLQPLTDYIPKPLIPINNVPIIEWQITYLKKFGIDKFVICCGYKHEQIETYLKSHNNFDVDVSFSIESTPLGTGGAIKNASSYLSGESFYVINGDVITSVNLKKLSINSIAAVQLPTGYGVLDIDGDFVLQFKEKGIIPDMWINAGVYLLSNTLLSDLPDSGNIEDTVFPNYAKKNLLKCVKFPDAIYYSIDSHKDRENCTKRMDDIVKSWNY